MGDPNEPFIVDFLPDEEVNLPGRIGMAGTPGASGRDLRADLTRLKKRYRADKLVTLLEGGQFVKDELAALGVPLLIAQTRRAGIAADWSPMPDGDVPVSVDSLFSLVERCLADARDGKIVVLHDAGGDGRVALAAAACLIALGASVDESMATVDMMRPGCVPNPSQRQTLRAFDEVWRKRALERAAPAAISDMFELGEAGGSSGPWRISQTGVAPLSRPGAAAVVYRGHDPEAERAGMPAAS
ncbi:MAG: hypothetical protein KC731_33290, partial [Myxococcales bacterium]|nr:hypothetical protein [Myxococcales bacterium]